MEVSQTINLIALSLIVVIHAGILALRLGISLEETKHIFCVQKFCVNNKRNF